MFNTPVKPDRYFDEGFVVQVDIIRKTCTVKTTTGQNLENVQWLTPSGGSSRSGDHVTPMFGDRVMINFSLGRPVIIGFLGRIQTEGNAFPINLERDDVLVDTGNYSTSGAHAFNDTNKPRDMLLGDRIITSIGGAVLGLLRGGSVLIRSSRLSEIYLSKIDDLARIVSRNWEHFTDVFSDVVKNFRGRIYRYTGYTQEFSKSKPEDYQYHQYIGDVAIAEKIKTNYLLAPSTLPEKTNIIFKEQITKEKVEHMYRTIDLEGNEEIWIQIPPPPPPEDGSAPPEGEQEHQFTRVRRTGTTLTFAYADKHIITIDPEKINIHHFDGADINLDKTGIKSTFKKGEVYMQEEKITYKFDESLITEDSAGIRLEYKQGKIDMNDGEVATTFGGHFVKVSAGGVAMG